MEERWATHLDAEVLEKYAMGVLPASETARVEEHLLLCENCCAALDETDRFLAGIRDVAGEMRDSAPKQSSIANRKAAG